MNNNRYLAVSRTVFAAPHPAGRPKANRLIAAWRLICRHGLPIFALGLAALGCNLTAPAATMTPPPTDLPTVTTTATLLPATAPPTITSTPTATLPPSRTPIPSATPTITLTPFPTVPPAPAVAIALDKLRSVEIDPAIQAGIGKLWFSFVNINDKLAASATPGTPLPNNNLSTLYLVAPAAPTQRLKVVDLPAAVEANVYWSPDGANLIYYLDAGEDSGIYLLSVRNGYLTRLFALPNLNPRGISSPPVWSPDGKLITLTFATAYDVDVFTIAPDGSGFRNVTQHPAYDFWPRWSPDGRFLAFVSDRLACPTWEPNVEGSCYAPDAPAPTGGNLFIYELATGQTTQISDRWLVEPPRWINNQRIAYTAGQRNDLLATTELGWIDRVNGAANPIVPSSSNALALSASWSSDGARVIYQEIRPDAQPDSRIVIRDQAGQEVGQLTDLAFPRFGFAGAWSPDGKRVAIGGRGGQCAFGLTLLDPQGASIFRANPRPGVCDPLWSPDGQYLAYAGVISGQDGNFSLYLASASGQGGRSVIGRLGGTIRMVGWVGATAP